MIKMIKTWKIRNINKIGIILIVNAFIVPNIYIPVKALRNSRNVIDEIRNRKL